MTPTFLLGACAGAIGALVAVGLLVAGAFAFASWLVLGPKKRTERIDRSWWRRA